MDHRTYYQNNKKYEKFLLDVKDVLYNKYVNKVELLSDKKETQFLDVGCGVGTVVNSISARKNIKSIGIDISQTFINRARKGNGSFKIFNGKKIPFENESFDIVGSFTVLEHVNNPKQLIQEMVRVTKQGGSVIIACPSFLRVFGFSATHHRTRGFINPIKNLFLASEKYIRVFLNPKDVEFSFMKPVFYEDLQGDDDAICETNMIDVRNYLKLCNVKIGYQSGLVNFHNSFFINLISELPIFRDLTGGFFIIGTKR